jgi:hypothetical protein
MLPVHPVFPPPVFPQLHVVQVPPQFVVPPQVVLLALVQQQ